MLVVLLQRLLQQMQRLEPTCFLSGAPEVMIAHLPQALAHAIFCRQVSKPLFARSCFVLRGNRHCEAGSSAFQGKQEFAIEALISPSH